MYPISTSLSQIVEPVMSYTRVGRLSMSLQTNDVFYTSPSPFKKKERKFFRPDPLPYSVPGG